MSKKCVCAAKHPGECKEHSVVTDGLYYYSQFEMHSRECLGEILTVIDATITNEQQNKAMKDVIKKSFYQTLTRVQKFCSDKDTVNGATWGQSVGKL